VIKAFQNNFDNKTKIRMQEISGNTLFAKIIFFDTRNLKNKVWSLLILKAFYSDSIRVPSDRCRSAVFLAEAGITRKF
jgi:hypothetical protein